MDRYLPELVFHMEELRSLICKYIQVVRHYYVQYLVGYDAVALAQMFQTMLVGSEEDSVLLSSICTKFYELSGKKVEDPGHMFGQPRQAARVRRLHHLLPPLHPQLFAFAITNDKKTKFESDGMASGQNVESAKVTNKAHAKLGTSSVNGLSLEQSVRTG